MPHPGELLGGRYRLDDRIASGGMGEVWQATDTVLGRAVAVKTLLADRASDAGFQRRFRHEARALAALRHPGVVVVYDFGSTEAEDAYLVMARVDGQPLNRILAERGRLTATETMSLVSQAASALAAAHAAGIVHRDVKPGNLLVEPDGTVVLVDFGVARSAHSGTLTGAREVVGTALYIAPEQVTKQEAGPAADVYALGALAFHCLAGHPPFLGDNPIVIALQHLDQDPPPLPADVPTQVSALVRTALAKDPADRFPSAEAMAEAARAAVAALDAETRPGAPTATGPGVPTRTGPGVPTGPIPNGPGATIGLGAATGPRTPTSPGAPTTPGAPSNPAASGGPAAPGRSGSGDSELAKTKTGAPWFGIAGVFPPDAASSADETFGTPTAGTGPAGAGPAGTGPAGADPAGTGPAGTGPAGADPAGTDPAGTPTAGLNTASTPTAHLNAVDTSSAGMPTAGMDIADGATANSTTPGSAADHESEPAAAAGAGGPGDITGADRNEGGQPGGTDRNDIAIASGAVLGGAAALAAHDGSNPEAAAPTGAVSAGGLAARNTGAGMAASGGSARHAAETNAANPGGSAPHAAETNATNPREPAPHAAETNATNPGRPVPPAGGSSATNPGRPAPQASESSATNPGRSVPPAGGSSATNPGGSVRHAAAAGAADAGGSGGDNGARRMRRALAVAAVAVFGLAGVLAAADPFGLFGGDAKTDQVVPTAPVSSVPRTVEKKKDDNKADYQQDSTPKPNRSAEPSRTTPTRPAETETSVTTEPTNEPTTGAPSTPEQTPTGEESAEPGENEDEAEGNEAAE